MGQALHVRAVVLPDEEERDVYVVGDRLTFEPQPGAQTVGSSGFVIPGLVDAHSHPGTARPSVPLDEDLLRAQAHEQCEGAVLAVRCPGAAAPLPRWYGEEPGTPRVQSAGRWVAAEGRFFRDWGRQAPLDGIVEAALDEALTAGGGWAKLVADWTEGRGDEQRYTPALPPEVIATAVERLHAAGVRVAVHSQARETAIAAVAAGVDTLEHGLHLPEDLLPEMAARGIALTPTVLVMSDIPSGLASRPRPPQMADLLRTGWERLPGLVRAAYEAGVTVLAGTDVLPQAHVAEEVRALHELAGVPLAEALGSASWVARRFLGLPGVEEGGLGDLVLYDADPRADVSVLARPARIIARGAVIR